jgi:hypothetical protein
LTDSTWQDGLSGWVEKQVTLSCISKSVQIGQSLEVKIVVGGNAGDDMWFAYDTVTQNSRLELP